MKKKPKKGAKPGTKPLTKLEPVPSFFSFFSPPEVPAEGTELSEDAIEELQATMEEDYEMGWVPCWQSPVSLWMSDDAIEELQAIMEEQEEDNEIAWVPLFHVHKVIVCRLVTCNHAIAQGCRGVGEGVTGACVLCTLCAGLT